MFDDPTVTCNFYFVCVCVFCFHFAGSEVLPVSWRAANEDVENADPASCGFQVGAIFHPFAPTCQRRIHSEGLFICP